ncbi:MAG TPA: polyprenyl diphosphate synthase [Acidimicrobiia bacterium]|nr:polyprenyl diphosphate synthase [Acidimicrobiia bacterium]
MSVDVDLHQVPGHVAIVGGGVDDASLADVVDGALDIGLRWLTIEVLPGEWWGDSLEVSRRAFAAAERLVLARRDEFHQRGVRIRGLGRRETRVPQRLCRALAEAEALTAGNHGMTLTLSVDHDGRVELADAMAALAAAVREGERRPSSIDEDALAAHLTAPDLPDPDLIVRTAGETTTTCFLVWQSAYSELVFTDVSWPEFGRADLFDAVAEYQRRERRFGAVDPS